MTNRWQQVLTVRSARATAAVALGAAAVTLAAAGPAAAVVPSPRAGGTAATSPEPGTAAPPGTASQRGSASLPANVKRVCAWPPPSGQPACLVLKRTDITGHIGRYSAGTDPAGYGRPNLANSYRLPGGSAGHGQTVALVDAFDDPNAAADLAVYRQQYGLPPCTTASGCFRKVNQNGQQSNYPPPDAGWAVEESLDIQMVSAICPNCHIILVEAQPSFTGVAAGVDTAVRLGADFVSNSYGAPDSSALTALEGHYSHPGVAVTVASGDSGYGVEWPASYPEVVAVGGTSLLPAANPRGWAEVVWTGTGSGCSGLRAKPSWQTDSGCPRRTDNDVAAVADPETGVAIYDTYQAGGWGVVGGTSVSSPIIASVYALAGSPAPGTNPASYLYSGHSGLFDIVAGTNKLVGPNCSPAYLCNGRAGYDGPTGWGAPDGVGAFAAPTHYVAMGDSYSSGEGVTPYFPDSNTRTDQCHRSKLGYPTLVRLPGQPLPIAQMGGDVTFSFIACAGAETTGITPDAAFSDDAEEEAWNKAHNTDWLEPQKVVEGPQAKSRKLTTKTTLVTISVGGNDARFGDVLYGCLVLAKALKTTCSNPNYTLFRDSTKAEDPMPLVDFEPKVITHLIKHLEVTYKAIHGVAGHAEIIVAGYPLLFPAHATKSCVVGKILLKTYTLNAADQNTLNDWGTQLNRDVSAAVANIRGTGVDIRFVDPTAAFAGHAICSSQPWINGLKGFSIGPAGLRIPNPASFHPTQAGQAAYARLVNGCLDGSVAC